MIKGTDLTFPFVENGEQSVNTGIDLRTWMATQFMAAKLCNKGNRTDETAKHAVEAADALIIELNKPQP